MKKYFLQIAIFLFLITGIATAQIGGMTLWYLDGTTLRPVDATWTLGVSGLAPSAATYITQTAHADLSAEQALSTLSTGIMRVATTTGVITSLTDSAGIAANISDESGTGVMAFTISPVFTTPNIGSATGSITGNAGSATYASATTITDDTTTAATMYPLWVTANTGNLATKVSSTKLSFVPSTGILTATGFSGPLTGNASTSSDLICTNCIGPTEITDLTLGTDTAGNYVASVATTAVTSGLTGGATGSEGAAISLGLDYSATLAGNPALGASQCVLASTGIICEGATADTIETLLTFTDPATADKTITFPNYTGTVALSGTLTNTKWCTTDGSIINCATNAPVLTEVDPTVDSEAEIEAITGAYFGASKAVTSGYIWVADGTDFESVVMSGDVTIASGGATTIGANKILESMLKAVDAAADEECLTYETTTGDFEWQVCGGGVPTTITVADTVDTTSYVALFEDATGDLGPKTDLGITYNAGTGMLTATGFTGPLTGNVTGNASTATALVANPGDCGANTWATTIAANGDLTCAAVTYAGISAMTSANWLGVISDEVGSGKLVFNTSTTLLTELTLGDSSGATFILTSALSGATDPTLTFGNDLITLSGDLTVSGGNINSGNIAFTIGDATTDSITFVTDGTGNAELVFPADGIGDADIDWGSGAGQVGYADLGSITVADTSITAGRSLTWSTNDMVADAELYTDTKCIFWENPVATDDFKSIWFAKQATTITSLWCESDQTVTFMLQVDDGSPADVDSTDLICDNTPPEDTTLNGDATMASGERLDIDMVSVSGTPTWVSICWTFTYDD